VLQFRVADSDLVDAYVESDPDANWGSPGFSKKVVMARLSRLDGLILREVQVESWMCGAPIPVRKAHLDLR
jgi:hypothetical protein